jgi:50S ribosomal protein L16 3-hydroxylase
VAKCGAHVDRRTQLLYDATHLFINGAALPWPANGAAALRQLANDRSLRPQGMRGLAPETAAILYNWYCDGYVHSGVA